MYLNAKLIGGFSNAIYWSSSNIDANNAWGQDFTNDFYREPEITESYTPNNYDSPKERDNTALYSNQLERLIEFALADGVLTEKEREVLLKKAKEEGVDADEFEMVLDARLFEKQSVMPQKPKEQPKPMDFRVFAARPTSANCLVSLARNQVVNISITYTLGRIG